MTGDACIAGDAYPVDAPGLTPFGVHVIVDCHCEPDWSDVGNLVKLEQWY